MLTFKLFNKYSNEVKVLINLAVKHRPKNVARFLEISRDFEAPPIRLTKINKQSKSVKNFRPVKFFYRSHQNKNKL